MKQNIDNPDISALDSTDRCSQAAIYFNNRGNGFKDQGKLDDAIACFHKAVEHSPGYAAAYNNLGNAYKFKNDLNRAVDYYLKAVQTNPQYADAYYNLGILFNECGRYQDAMAAYRKAVLLQPDFFSAHFNLGNILRELGKLDEAVQCYRMALEINPDYAAAYNGLATVYQEQGKLDKAALNYQKHMHIKTDTGVEIKASLLLPVICESTRSIITGRDAFSKNLEKLSQRHLRLQDPPKQIGKTNFYLAYHGLDNKQLQEKIARFYLDACPDLGWQVSSKQSGSYKDGKLKIGFISRYLRDHTIGHLNYGLIKYLDRQRFEVTTFSLPGINDNLSTDITEAADQTVILPAQLSLARQIIAQQALDILFYLDIGMDPLTYFLAFSRLAPIQCTTWGHPDTTGIPNMDYYISSLKAEPPGAQTQYTEKLILFNQFPMYCRRPQSPGQVLTRRDLDLPQDRRLYVCIQSLFKVHPDFDDIIAEILRRDPEGIIVFFEGKHTHWGKLLRKRFARRLPDALNRVRFLNKLPPEDFLAFLQIPDVLLDTPHFSGGYTSLLAFAMGVPIVTWPGRFMRGRLTYSFYKEMGILDTIADSREAYIQIACKLANDKLWREDIRNKIKKRSGCLYDNPTPVQELENFSLWASRQATRRGN